MGLVDRGKSVGLDANSVDLDSWTSGDGALVLALLAAITCLILLLSTVIVLISCACCGGDGGNANKAREAVTGPADIDGKSQMSASNKSSKSRTSERAPSAKEKSSGKGKHSAKGEPIADLSFIPYEVRLMPKPTSHKIPLAPPGATVPPPMMPGDDDPTVNVEMGKKSVKG